MNSKGKRVIVLTGKMRLERRKIEADITDKGHVVGARVDASTDLLVVPAGRLDDAGSTKAKAARAAGIPIIDESTLNQLLRGGTTFVQAMLMGGGERPQIQPKPRPATSRKKTAAINRQIRQAVKAMGRNDSIYRASF